MATTTMPKFTVSVFKSPDVEPGKPWVAFARNNTKPVASGWACFATETEAQEEAHELRAVLPC